MGIWSLPEGPCCSGQLDSVSPGDNVVANATVYALQTQSCLGYGETCNLDDPEKCCSGQCQIWSLPEGPRCSGQLDSVSPGDNVVANATVYALQTQSCLGLGELCDVEDPTKCCSGQCDKDSRFFPV